MEYLKKLPENKPKLKAVLFDFDGTISTLRNGWESIMEPMMLEMIAGSHPIDPSLVEEVKSYIDQSTGIQTIYQMQWLADTVKRYGNNPDLPDDPWWYKEEYNRRLMVLVEKRIKNLKDGNLSPDDFLIGGSKVLLEALSQKGAKMYVASGTDDPDVKNEAEILGVAQYFTEIAGAPLGKADCSKEATLIRLIHDNDISGPSVVVIGDGKVEIMLGNEVGAITLGTATDEDKRHGINPIKRKRLIRAGAHAITGDFKNADEILTWLGIA